MRKYKSVEATQRIAIGVQDALDALELGIPPEGSISIGRGNNARAVDATVREFIVAADCSMHVDDIFNSLFKLVMPKSASSGTTKLVDLAIEAVSNLELLLSNDLYRRRRRIWLSLPFEDRVRRIRTLSDEMKETMATLTEAGQDPRRDDEWKERLENLEEKAGFDSRAANAAGFRNQDFWTDGNAAPQADHRLRSVPPARGHTLVGVDELHWRTPGYVEGPDRCGELPAGEREG